MNYLRKNAVLLTIGFVLAILIVRLHVIDSIFVFLLTGLIPGTDLSLSPFAMVVLFFATVWFISLQAGYSIRDSLIASSSQQKTASRRNLPKRRFAR